MKLNRKARRKNRSRPNPLMTPAQQMSAFLKAPGKFHIVYLPDDKSFVVKVTEDEQPLFQTMIYQLRGVLGYCETKGATPLDAHVADHQEVAISSAESTKRIREARMRVESGEVTDEWDAQTPEDLDELAARRTRRRETGTMPVDPTGPDDEPIDEHIAARTRHPAGKGRGPRHAKPEPDTVFDQLAAGADNEEGERRLAAMQLAATQSGVAEAQAELDRANQAYAEAAARAAELNNQRILDNWTERAAHAIEQVENDGRTPIKPRWKMTVAEDSRIAGEEPAAYGCPGCGDRVTTAEHECPRYRISDGEPQTYGIDWKGPDDPTPFPTITTAEQHTIDCSEPTCLWSRTGTDKGALAIAYGEHWRSQHGTRP